MVLAVALHNELISCVQIEQNLHKLLKHLHVWCNLRAVLDITETYVAPIYATLNAITLVPVIQRRLLHLWSVVVLSITTKMLNHPAHPCLLQWLHAPINGSRWSVYVVVIRIPYGTQLGLTVGRLVHPKEAV